MNHLATGVIALSQVRSVALKYMYTLNALNYLQNCSKLENSMLWELATYFI